MTDQKGPPEAGRPKPITQMTLRELRALGKAMGIRRAQSFQDVDEGIAAVRAARRAASRVKPGSDGTIRAYAEDLLRQPITYSAALEKVREAFPDCNASRSSLRWYASQMRRRGEDLPARPIDFHPRPRVAVHAN